MEKRKIW